MLLSAGKKGRRFMLPHATGEVKVLNSFEGVFSNVESTSGASDWTASGN